MKKDDNPYIALKEHFGKFFSIMHDGIQKFSIELNGVFIRTVLSNIDTVTVTNIPWSLTKIPGGSLNAVKLIEHIFQIIKSVHPLSDTKKASTAFKKLSVEEHGVDFDRFPELPTYFEIRKLEKVDWNLGVVFLVCELWPVAITADGCSVNVAAGNKLRQIWTSVTQCTMYCPCWRWFFKEDGEIRNHVCRGGKEFFSVITCSFKPFPTEW